MLVLCFGLVMSPGRAVGQLTTVVGTVIEDENGNGVVDPGETTGVPGVRIAMVDPVQRAPLSDASGKIIELVTDADGDFSYQGTSTVHLGFRPWDPSTGSESEPLGEPITSPVVHYVEVPAGGTSSRMRFAHRGTESDLAQQSFHLWNFRSGPVCDAGAAETGRPPSDRICEDRDVPVRGRDTCVFDGDETRCTWWGFEFDYANADPDVLITCVWTRSRPINEGNYEEIRKRSVATDTTNFKLEDASGHYFFPGFDNFPVGFPHPWYTVDMEYDCSYPGTGRLFLAEYRLIFSSVFD